MGVEKKNFKIHYLEIAVINAALCEFYKHLNIDGIPRLYRNKKSREAANIILMLIRDRLLELSDKMVAEICVNPIRETLMKEWEEAELFIKTWNEEREFLKTVFTDKNLDTFF